MSYAQIANELGCSKSSVAYHCGAGQKDKQAVRNKDTRYKRLQKVSEMKNKPCMDCGNSYPSECMDFDHVRGEKVNSISNLIALASWQDVLDEIAKCELVCANCHRIRTKARGNLGWGYTSL